METDIKIKNYNNVYVKIECNRGILFELQEHFTFELPNAKHMKRKFLHWDGKIRLLNGNKKTIYVGLVFKLKTIAEEMGYSVSIEDGILEKEQINIEDLKQHIIDLNLPDNKETRDYQFEGVKNCLEHKRCLILSPTASGKSLLIYLLYRILNIKTLLIVPRISLCAQMKSDFIEYATNDDFDVENSTSLIMAGADKNNLKDLTISTWQSIDAIGSKKKGKINLEKKQWLENFDMVIVDEAHHAQANSLKEILENFDGDYRFGFTGTTDGTETNEMVLEGLFGPIIKLITTRELIDQNYIADLKINCILLKYKKETKKLLSGKYQEEKEFLLSHKRRNKFICDLALKLEGNTLILFKEIKTQGKELLTYLEANSNNKKVYYVDGSVDVDERELIRKEYDNTENNIWLASIGTTGTGMNAVNIKNIILASPSKSRIQVLQNIGRGLRKSSKKTHLVVFDIADDLARSKSMINHTYRHFIQRLKMYSSEEFDYQIKELEIE